MLNWNAISLLNEFEQECDVQNSKAAKLDDVHLTSIGLLSCATVRVVSRSLRLQKHTESREQWSARSSKKQKTTLATKGAHKPLSK